MSVSIRLYPIGRKGKRIYRIVASEKKSKLKSKTLDVLGFYDPTSKPPKTTINMEKLNKWIKNGAIISQGLAKIQKP